MDRGVEAWTKNNTEGKIHTHTHIKFTAFDVGRTNHFNGLQRDLERKIQPRDFAIPPIGTFHEALHKT